MLRLSGHFTYFTIEKHIFSILDIVDFQERRTLPTNVTARSLENRRMDRLQSIPSWQRERSEEPDGIWDPKHCVPLP